MRCLRSSCWAVALGVVVSAAGSGCGDSSNTVADVQQLKAPPSVKELPASPKQGGGPTSSGNSGKNPGASS